MKKIFNKSFFNIDIMKIMCVVVFLYILYLIALGGRYEKDGSLIYDKWNKVAFFTDDVLKGHNPCGWRMDWGKRK